MTMQDVTTAGNGISANGSFRVANIGGGQSRGDLSKQWMARPADERFLSLSALREHTRKRADKSKETRVENRKFELLAPEPVAGDPDSIHRLDVGLPGGECVALTHHSFNQIAGLARFPAEPLRRLPSQITADALNYCLRYTRDVEEVKTYHSDELMAVTGPDYGRIYDHDVVGAVQQVAGNGTGDERWKIPGVMDWRTMIYDPRTPVTKDTTTLYASDRDVFMFLVDDLNPIAIGKTKDGADDIMFRGFYISNSEMGTRSMKLAAFYLRAICCNRIMWGVEHFEEMTLRHSKNAPGRFIEQARPALRSFAEGSARTLIEGVAKAKAARVASDQDEAVAFLAARKFSKRRIAEVLESVEREEGHPARTAWDMAQGLTAVARALPNNDDRVDMESVASAILDKVAA